MTSDVLTKAVEEWAKQQVTKPSELSYDIIELIESIKSVLRKEIDDKEILRNHVEVVEDYIHMRGVKAQYPKSIEEFLEHIKERIQNFGYGSTTFHTADIELLLKLAQKFNGLKLRLGLHSKEYEEEKE